MPAGRPREHNREQIAIDIIEWAKKPDSINLNKFCVNYEPPFPPTQLSIWGSQEPEFRKSVEIAKGHLAARREEKLNSEELHVKGYDLNASVYDLLIRDERRQQLEFESKLKAQEVSTVSEQQEAQHKALMNQLDSLKSSLNKDESK